MCNVSRKGQPTSVELNERRCTIEDHHRKCTYGTGRSRCQLRDEEQKSRISATSEDPGSQRPFSRPDMFCLLVQSDQPFEAVERWGVDHEVNALDGGFK